MADGATYYALLNNMLSTTFSVVATKATRKLKDYSMVDAMGAKTYAYVSSPSHVLGLLCGLVKEKLRLRKYKVFCFYVNQDEVARVKAMAKSADKVHLLSTNDIVTSAIMSKLNMDICLMTINLRGRNPKVAPTDAGNYTGFAFYSKSVFSTPEGIRKSLDGAKGALPFPKLELCGRPLPGHFHRLTSRSGLVTSWATFAGEINVDRCEQLLHLPLVPNEELFFIDAVIFKTNGRTAVMIFSRHFKRAHWESIAVLGEPVSESIFC